ncbi:VOC family protein [Niallia sp. RD1]|uniref:VOC family protein n=1 Tax=Niallia sp. RD1 TaxID=2962858 RepID=UPI0020C1AC1F|nr:VOC family protein [Niallia sp. RD1]UTI43947.1 VOC family protein [Niallia sp. RD1]
MAFHDDSTIYARTVTLKVSNLENSLLFYTDIMGFSVASKEKKKAALCAGAGEPFLFLEELEEVEPKTIRTTGLYHFAILVPSREDLGLVLNHLLDTGYPLQGASDHFVSEAIYLADPDGNGIEVYRDRKATEWEWDGGLVKMDTTYMDTKAVLKSARNGQWGGLPEGTILGHIHLHVAELTETVDFYVKGLGYDIVQKYGSQAFFLSTGGYHHHIGLNVWNGIGAPAPKTNQVGLAYYDLKIPSQEKLEEIKQRLTQLGALIMQKEGKWYTSDPSGNTIHLTVI